MSSGEGITEGEQPSGQVFRFDDVTADSGRLEVHRGGQPVDMEPQVLDVLLYLLAHRERVVSKIELLDQVWGDRFVTDSAVANRISAARQAVGDDGRRQGVIRTVHGKGYRVVADVSVAEDGGGSPSAVRTEPEPRAVHRKRTYGRDEALAATEQHIFPGSIVTLVGPAGVGKTHLSRAIEALVGDRLDDGSWFVPLANVRDEEAVVHAVLDAIGVPKAAGGTPKQTLLATLRGVNGLLILDNCEHLVEACAELVGQLREARSTVSVLATSRQRLAVPGEQLVEVGVLDPASSAALLVERAASVGVELSAQSDDVEALCAKLDYLPLALELAGAHLRVLGLSELMAMLHHRLELLRGVGNVDPHHQTLEVAIGSSFDMLEPSRQHTLGNLSVFAGPFDLEAAIAIATAGIDVAPVEAMTHVIDLAERSLLVVEGDTGQRRYRLLESVRLFVEARFEGSDEVEAAHVQYFVLEAERQAERLQTGDYWIAYAEMPRLWDNCRAAVGYALRGNLVDEACRLITATVDFAEFAQRLEHADWARRVLANESSGERFDEVRAGLARLLALDDLEEAQRLLATIEPGSSMSALLASAWSAVFLADAERVSSIADDLEGRVRGSGGVLELSVGTFLVSLRTMLGQDAGRLRDMVAEAAAVSGSFGEQFVLLCDAQMASARGDDRAALKFVDRAIELGVEHNLELSVLAATRLRSQVLIAVSDTAEAIEHVTDSIEQYSEHGRWIGVLLEAPYAARLLYQHGNVAAAARTLSVLAHAQLPESWSGELTEPLVAEMIAADPEVADLLRAQPPSSFATFAAFIQAELRSISR